MKFALKCSSETIISIISIQLQDIVWIRWSRSLAGQDDRSSIVRMSETPLLRSGMQLQCRLCMTLIWIKCLRELEGHIKQWKISIINDSSDYQRYFSATLSLSIQLLSQRLQLFLCFFTMLLNYAPYCFHDRWSKEQGASFASKMFNFASIQRSTMDLHTMHLHTMISDASLDSVFLNSTSLQWSAMICIQHHPE